MRLAVVLSHPTQYYSPWFRWVAQNTAIQLRVFYLWDFGVTTQLDPKFGTSLKWDVDLLSGYAHEVVPNVSGDPGTHHINGLNNPALIPQLAAWRPDAILLFGYKWATHLRVVAWARWKRIPLIFRGDSHFLGRGAPNWTHRLALRTLFAQFSAFLVVGEANAEYFSTAGVPACRQFQSPHSVNHTLFDSTVPSHIAASNALRRELALAPDCVVILYAGKLVPEKQPLELLSAFLDLNAPRTALVYVGDGSEKAVLLARAQTAPPGSVHFLPFANQSEMPARYLLADIFTLPSGGWYETWGLAVNEAMHMGVPALVSDLVGCQRDLVTDNVTGWVFPSRDMAALRAKLATAIEEVSQPERREQLRGAVQQRIAQYTYAQTTAGLVEALCSLRK